MPYKGEKIMPTLRRLEKATKPTGRRLAEAMIKHGQDRIEQNTPVETYHLRRSYKKSRVRYQQDSTLGYVSIRWSAWVWTGTVYTEVEYAPYVEEGTGLFGPRRRKYKIEPKKPGGVLAFTNYERSPSGGVILDVHGKPQGGATVFVRFVMHPGSPGQHMFRIGALITEDEYEEWSREPLRLWREAVEGTLAA